MAERRLILVRHAKAKQGSPDLDRPLAHRGRDDARAVGQWLSAHDSLPDLAVVSPARRSVQTWEVAASQLATVPRVRTDERVYDNTVQDLVAVIGDCDESVTTLAIIGHNPSVQDLTVRVADDEQGRELGMNFPTATIAVVEFDGLWSSLEESLTTLSHVVTCRG